MVVIVVAFVIDTLVFRWVLSLRLGQAIKVQSLTWVGRRCVEIIVFGCFVAVVIWMTPTR